MLRRLRGQILFNVTALALQTILGLAAIPIGTAVLSADHYGAYSLALAFLAPLVGIAEASASMTLSSQWVGATPQKKAEVLTSTCVFALAAFVLLGLPLVALVLLVIPALGLSPHLLVFIAAALPFGVLSAVLRSMVILERQSWVASLALLTQSAVSLAALTVCLYELQWTISALFLAYLAGAVAQALLVLVVAARTIGFGRCDAGQTLVGFRNLPSTLSATALEYGRGIAESSIVASQFGLASLGLLSHARIYQGMLIQGTNTVANAVWPLALEEAKRGNGQFHSVRRSWNLAYFAVGLAGIFIGCFGRDAIGLLSHGRFVDAAPLVSILIVVVFVQISGRAVMAAVYVNDLVRMAMVARSASLALAVVVLLMATPVFGFAAVMGSILGEAVCYRLLLMLIARRSGPLPFLDHLVVGGIVVTCLAALLPATASMTVRTVVALALLGGWAIFCRKTVLDGLALLATMTGRLKTAACEPPPPRI